MKKILVIINKNWETEPVLNALTNPKLRPAALPFPEVINTPCDGDNRMSQPRAVFSLPREGEEPLQVVVRCIEDLMATGVNTSSSLEKYKVLPQTIAADAADLEALNAVAADGRTVADKVTEKSGQTGEKVELVYYAKIEAPMCVTYIHTNHKLGTLIGFNKEIGMEVAKDVAMQAAAMAPISISREDCDPAVIEHERSIGREQARLDGKPEAMLDKIAEGKVNKFLTENTLLSQPLVKNNKLSVGAYIKQDDPQATVVAYKRFSLND